MFQGVEHVFLALKYVYSTIFLAALVNYKKYLYLCNVLT